MVMVHGKRSVFVELIKRVLLCLPIGFAITGSSTTGGLQGTVKGFSWNKITFLVVVSVNNDSTTVQRRPDVYPVSNCSLAGQKINAGILPTSLRCSAHVVLNSSDLTSSYPITSSTQRITTTEFKDVSHEDLILSIQNMKNSLAVNKSETSSEIRKKISVYESRTSAVSMGLIGTIVIVLVILCPVISDLTSVIQRRKK